MLTNPMLVMLKKLKLSLKRLKLKSLRKTKKHQFPLAFALINQCFIVLLKLIIFKGKIWTNSGSVEWRCFFPEHLILNFFRLKVKVKVDLLKLTLKLGFPHNYFQILRQKYSKSLYLENVKVRRLQYSLIARLVMTVQLYSLPAWLAGAVNNNNREFVWVGWWWITV